MAAKAILVLCAQALLIQSAFSQCLGRAGIAGRGWGYDGLGRGCGYSAIDYTATSGGGLPVASGSCIPPVGVSLASENVYEGRLATAGELPFVGTVGVEGVLPTAGAGAVNYGCGNGCTGMVAADGLLGAGGYGAGIAGRGWGYDGLGRGCGCSAIDYTATSGGGLPVASGSCIPPVGVSLASENAYEGHLTAAGELPFVGTVGVEGVLPTAGAGAVNYGCGNGCTGMVAADGLLGAGGYGAGIGGYGAGFGAGWGGRGCGCGCGL